MCLVVEPDVRCDGAGPASSPTHTQINSPHRLQHAQPDCHLRLDIFATSDIAVRQPTPGGGTAEPCTYRIHERHWKQAESRAYDAGTSLDIVSKVSCFYSLWTYSAVVNGCITGLASLCTDFICPSSVVNNCRRHSLFTKWWSPQRFSH